jgi:hypothetical protein
VCHIKLSQEAADYLNRSVLRPDEPRRQWDEWCGIYGTPKEKRSDEWQRSHVLLRTLRSITPAAAADTPPPAAYNVTRSALKQLGHGRTGLGTGDTASAWAEQLPAASAHQVALREAALAKLPADAAEAEKLRVTAARENAARTFAWQARKMEAEWQQSDELASTSPTDTDLVLGAKTAMRDGGLLLAAASEGGLGDECRAVDGDGWEILKREAGSMTRFRRDGALRGRIAGVDALECVPPSCPPCARITLPARHVPPPEFATRGCRGGTQGLGAQVAHLVLQAMLQHGAVVARVFNWIPNTREALGANRLLCEVWVRLPRAVEDGEEVYYCSAAELLLAYGMACPTPQSSLASFELALAYEAAHVASVAAARESMVSTVPNAAATPEDQARAWHARCAVAAKTLPGFLGGSWLPTQADVQAVREPEGSARGRGKLCVLTPAGR